MDKVRWGLLSTARINRHLIPAIRASQQGDLVGVASRKRERADAYAAEWGIPRAFGSYEAMLGSQDIDAVYISLPNHLHAEWSVLALQAGKHVLCEKPLALSVEEVERMMTASRKTGRALAEAFMYRHHPQTKIAGDWVRQGRLGEISLVRAVFNFAIQSRRDIRLVPEYGGGCLWDVGVYPMSFAQFILGEPPQRASGAQWIGDTGVDETFAGHLQYAQGAIAQVASSFRTPFYTSAEIIGTEGRLMLNRPFVWFDEAREMIFHPQDGEPFEVQVPEQALYLGEVEDMHAAILEGKPNYLSLEESRDHIRTVETLYGAARDQRTVDL